jgi:hypothetical protein
MAAGDDLDGERSNSGSKKLEYTCSAQYDSGQWKMMLDCFLTG